MNYLTIDCTKWAPTFHLGLNGYETSLQNLDSSEISDYAKWLGVVGGRELLDAFEVALINAGMLYIWPVGADDQPLNHSCNAISINHHDDGLRILWEPRNECRECGGDGYHGLPDDDDPDMCTACDGDGEVIGEAFETDIDGLPLRVSPLDRMAGRP